MTKYVVVIEAFDDNDAIQFAYDGGRGMTRAIHEVYRSSYDIDYNMTKFLCMPPVGDPKPKLADEEYLFKIGLVTNPENFDEIRHKIEKMATALSVDYLSYESQEKPVSDAETNG